MVGWGRRVGILFEGRGWALMKACVERALRLSEEVMAVA